MIPEYRYQVRIDCIALPLFMKWMVRPLFRIIPWWLPANIITIIANLFMYAALVLSITDMPSHSIRFILIAMLILAYAIGDHFDGMQAKRTGTSSALGEFCDHFLDIFNNGVLLTIICILFHITHPALIAFFLLAGYLPHAAIFFEQFSTKWLYFERLSSLESVLILTVLILISAISPVYNLLLSHLFGTGLSIIAALFLLSSSGAFITFAKVVKRAHATDMWFWTFCLLLTAVSLLAAHLFPPAAICTTITLYGGLYIANLQRGHLADGRRRIPDPVTPVLLLLMLIFPMLRTPAFMLILCTYLACHILWIAANTVYILRGFWVWKNPRLQ